MWFLVNGHNTIHHNTRQEKTTQNSKRKTTHTRAVWSCKDLAGRVSARSRRPQRWKHWGWQKPSGRTRRENKKPRVSRRSTAVYDFNDLSINDEEHFHLVVVLEQPDIVGVAEGEGIEEVPEVGSLVLDGLPGHLEGSMMFWTHAK